MSTKTSRERLFGLTSSTKHNPSWWRSHGYKKARCLGPVHMGSGSREKQKLSLSLFFLFIHPRTPAHGLVPSTFRVGLPKSINPIQNLPHRHAREFVSIKILNVIQLTMKMKPCSHYVPHPDSQSSCSPGSLRADWPKSAPWIPRLREQLLLFWSFSPASLSRVPFLLQFYKNSDITEWRHCPGS